MKKNRLCAPIASKYNKNDTRVCIYFRKHFLTNLNGIRCFAMKQRRFAYSVVLFSPMKFQGC